VPATLDPPVPAPPVPAPPVPALALLLPGCPLVEPAVLGPEEDDVCPPVPPPGALEHAAAKKTATSDAVVKEGERGMGAMIRGHARFRSLDRILICGPKVLARALTRRRAGGEGMSKLPPAKARPGGHGSCSTAAPVTTGPTRLSKGRRPRHPCRE
jgi:hypothetical protein